MEPTKCAEMKTTGCPGQTLRSSQWQISVEPPTPPKRRQNGCEKGAGKKETSPKHSDRKVTLFDQTPITPQTPAIATSLLSRRLLISTRARPETTRVDSRHQSIAVNKLDRLCEKREKNFEQRDRATTSQSHSSSCPRLQLFQSHPRAGTGSNYTANLCGRAPPCPLLRDKQ